MNFVSFDIVVRFSESGDRWASDAGESRVNFVIPEAMYSGSNLVKLVDSAITDAKKAYPEAKRIADEKQAKWEEEYAERQRQKEEEKAKVEAEAQT